MRSVSSARPREVLCYKLPPVTAVPMTWGTWNGPKGSDKCWTRERTSGCRAAQTCNFPKNTSHSPLLGSSAGTHCSTSSGCRKSLFRTSMTWILLRLTRSTSCNFFSSSFTISLLGWLVKIVIWNTNQSMKKLPLPQFSLERWRCWVALVSLWREEKSCWNIYSKADLEAIFFFKLWVTFKPIWNGLRGSLEEHLQVLCSVHLWSLSLCVWKGLVH